MLHPACRGFNDSVHTYVSQVERGENKKSGDCVGISCLLYTLGLIGGVLMHICLSGILRKLQQLQTLLIIM